MYWKCDIILSELNPHGLVGR